MRVTAWAYSWVGSDEVVCDALPVASFYDHAARRAFLAPLLKALLSADVWTGHHIARADIPWIQGECFTLGLPPLRPALVQDTMRIRARVKKGQDNLAYALGVREEKLPLSWAQWEAAYAEPDLGTVKERVAGDVAQHKALREALRKAGWLKPPRLWRP